jgi:drug/metabolite transporter (DMT)-like permease
MTILGSYIVAYSIRIYIMNYYKNTRAKGVKLDNNGFFAIEQITASIAMFAVGLGLFRAGDWFGAANDQITYFHDSFVNPNSFWFWAIVSGMAYGMVAFFSVFIFMFKGRTATFAGLVNRLTSLVAGTAATLVSAIAFAGKFPKSQDWISLVFILIAVGFLSRAERKRITELALSKEVDISPVPGDLIPAPRKA